MSELTKEQAVALAESKFWETMSFEDRAKFQINQGLLCMPFDVFHEAVEKTLNRPVWTHEFGMNYEGIKKEIMNGEEPPTFLQILELIPEDKKNSCCAMTKLTDAELCMDDAHLWSEYGQDGFCVSSRFGMTPSLNNYMRQKLGSFGNVFAARYKDGRLTYLLVAEGWIMKESARSEDIAMYIDMIAAAKKRDEWEGRKRWHRKYKLGYL